MSPRESTFITTDHTSFGSLLKLRTFQRFHNVDSNNTLPALTYSNRIGLPAPSSSRGNPPFPDRRSNAQVNALSQKRMHMSKGRWNVAFQEILH